MGVIRQSGSRGWHGGVFGVQDPADLRLTERLEDRPPGHAVPAGDLVGHVWAAQAELDGQGVSGIASYSRASRKASPRVSWLNTT
jgi:hypothetical protein